MNRSRPCLELVSTAFPTGLRALDWRSTGTVGEDPRIRYKLLDKLGEGGMGSSAGQRLHGSLPVRPQTMMGCALRIPPDRPDIPDRK